MVNYREYVFCIPTTPQETLNKGDFNNNKSKLIENAHENKYRHMSLFDVNKANIGSKITNADISETFKENRGEVNNNVNGARNQEFEPEQRKTFWRI